MRYPPEAAELEVLALKAVDTMPSLFREKLADVLIRVEEFADDETITALGLEDSWELSGVYEGRPLIQDSLWVSGEMPARIRLFRRPLLDEWIETGVALEALIRHVLVHEVGHHFGFSDDDMHRIEAGTGSDEPDE